MVSPPRVVRFGTGLAFTVGAAGAVVALSAVRRESRTWELIGPRWARGLLRICGVEVQVWGQERLAGPAVFVANHQSFLDPMVLIAALPERTKWVAKAEFRHVPVLGRAFGACAIYVDRRDPAAAKSALSDGLLALPAGWSVGVFPEGTRSADRQLQAFKKGAVHLAIQLGLPVVPLGVTADPATLPRNPGLIRPGVIHVEVGPALPSDAWRAEDAAQHTDQLQVAVAQCLARAQARV
jgi:1-acyl-sn-glycerol-3-phosphate acyltransferase